MAKKGTLSKLLVDEFDFSGETSSITATVTMGEEERTTLQADAMAYEPILPSLKIEHAGYLFTDGNLEEQLHAKLGVDGVIVGALFGTDIVGCPAYVLGNTFGQTLNIQSPAAGLVTINGAWGMGQGGHRGIRIFDGEVDTTGSLDAVDLGAVGSNGGSVFAWVLDIDGSATDAVITVESATTEGGTYAEEAEIEFSAVGGYAAAMTGTVNRWVRVNVDDLGGADAVVVVVVVCVPGVTE